MKQGKFDLSASLFIAVEIRDFQWRLEKELLKSNIVGESFNDRVNDQTL